MRVEEFCQIAEQNINKKFTGLTTSTIMHWVMVLLGERSINRFDNCPVCKLCMLYIAPSMAVNNSTLCECNVMNPMCILHTYILL